MIPHEIMGFFAHVQTVDTRPLFPPPTWPGYEASVESDKIHKLKQLYKRLPVFFNEYNNQYTANNVLYKLYTKMVVHF